MHIYEFYRTVRDDLSRFIGEEADRTNKPREQVKAMLIKCLEDDKEKGEINKAYKL